MPQIDMQQAVDFMVPALRNAKVKLFVLNNFRVGEPRGARDLSAFVDLIENPSVKAKVIRHTADEGRHQYVLAKRMTEVGGPGPPPGGEGIRLPRAALRGRACCPRRSSIAATMSSAP